MDAGTHSNPMVALGEARVAHALGALGADVRIVRIPYYHPQESDPEKGLVWLGEDQGPDDYIARCGADAFGKLVESAELADPASRMSQTLEGLTPKDRPIAAGNLLRELSFAASLHVGGPTVLSAVAAFSGRTGINKGDLKDAKKAFEDRLAARAKQDRPEWTNKLIRSSNGAPKAIRDNVETCLRNDPALVGMIGYNNLSQSGDFRKAPPWADYYTASAETKADAVWTDPDDIRLAGNLSRTYHIHDLPITKIR